jgi:ankyrin repeat protein
MGKLIDAVTENKLSEVKELLLGEYKGSRLINEEIDKNKHTPLFIAALHGYIDIVSVLIDNSAKIDYPVKEKGLPGAVPLHAAALNGHTNVASLLLKHNANVDPVTTNEFTPLYLAAQNKHIETMRVLLKYGAKVEGVKRGITPLHLAAFQNNVSVMQLLLEYSAAVDRQMNDGIINHFYTDGATPLHLAAFWGHAEAIQLLIQSGAQVDKPMKGGATPLYIIVEREGLVGDSLILEKSINYLLEGGADVHANTRTSFFYGYGNATSPFKLATDRTQKTESRANIILGLFDTHLKKKQKSNVIVNPTISVSKNDISRQITPDWKTNFEKAREFYNSGKSAYYRKDNGTAITFFLQAKDKYKDVLQNKEVDALALKEAEKRSNKLKNPNGKYSPMKLGGQSS